MTNSMDIEYICTHLGNLYGVPVRLFDGDALAFYYSIVSLPKDPFERYKADVFAISSHVGYFVTPHDSYYGVVNFGARRLVLGPTRQMPCSEQELHDVAFENDVPAPFVGDFVAGLKMIVLLPLARVIQLLCLVNHLLNEGETLSLRDVTVVEAQQQHLIRTFGEQAAQSTLDALDGRWKSQLHNTTDVEAYMLQAVREGDVDKLNAFFKNIPAIQGGVIAQNDLRQAKNLVVVTATLVSRAVMQAGMDAEEALSLSDRYIQTSETLSDVAALTNLNYRLVMDYAERMARLRLGGNPSKLLAEVNAYIRSHLSQAITVEEMARALCRGRSRLSTDFKKETGENLSVYVLKHKIAESKNLLRYTEKPAVEIALYLGFCSQSHFSRVFKQYVGCTPNEYRLATRS